MLRELPLVFFILSQTRFIVGVPMGKGKKLRKVLDREPIRQLSPVGY